MSDRVLKQVQLPFDLYDFFGYLYPGMFFALCLYVISGLLTINSGYTFWDYTRVVFTPFHDLQFIEAVIVLLIVGLVFYLLGHFIASLSSLLFEKKLLKGIFGYPTQHYLGIKDGRQGKLSESLYKLLFVSSNLAMILGIWAVAAPTFEGPFYLLLWGTASMVAAWAILVWLAKPRLPKLLKRHPVLDRLRAKIVKGIYHFVHWTIDAPASVAFASTNVLSKFDDDFIVQFKSKYHKDFGLNVKADDTNAFWLSYAFLVQNCPTGLPTIRNFLHMYSFARNIAAASFLALVATLLTVFWVGLEPEPGYAAALRNVLMAIYVLGMVMVLRYFYLYSSYYTKYILRSYFVTKGGNETAQVPFLEKVLSQDS